WVFRGIFFNFSSFGEKNLESKSLFSTL
ncbi:hypothetical protein O6P43_025871, partial [Quillaja saponaria]